MCDSRTDTIMIPLVPFWYLPNKYGIYGFAWYGTLKRVKFTVKVDLITLLSVWPLENLYTDRSCTSAERNAYDCRLPI